MLTNKFLMKRNISDHRLDSRQVRQQPNMKLHLEEIREKLGVYKKNYPKQIYWN